MIKDRVRSRSEAVRWSIDSDLPSLGNLNRVAFENTLGSMHQRSSRAVWGGFLGGLQVRQTYISVPCERPSTLEVQLESEWTVIARSAKLELTTAEVASIVSAINAALRGHNFNLIDAEIASLDVKKMNPDAICAVARTTASARNRLANWDRFIRLGKNRLHDSFPESNALEGIEIASPSIPVHARQSRRARNPKKLGWNISFRYFLLR